MGEPKHLASPDISGCNWNLDYISNVHAHLFDVGTALATVKRKWNLPARSTADSIRPELAQPAAS